MKILIFEGDINNAISGFRKNLVVELLNSNHQVTIVGFRAYEGNFGNLDSAKTKNVKLYSLGSLTRNPFKIIIIFYSLIKILIRTKPDVSLSFNIRPILIYGIINSIFRIPSIATVTGTSTLRDSNDLRKLPKLLCYLFLRNYRTVFFQNEFDQNLFKVFNFPNTKYRLTPGSGVDTSYYNKLNFKDEINVEFKTNFLLVSRLIRQKGILEYIEAAEKLKSEMPWLIFGILGPHYNNSNENNSIPKDLIESAVSRDIIKYFGYNKKVEHFILKSDCIVLPSYGEGLSNVLLESASLEKPLLASNVPGCKEIIKEGFNGYLFEARNTNSLIQSIRKFLSLSKDLQVQMGIEGRKIIISTFEKKIVVQLYIEEVNKIS